MGIPSFMKYEDKGGPGIVSVMEALNESMNREVDRRNFMKTQIIFFLMAATDGHAKNFSIRWGPAGFDMTPLYDVLSVQPMMDSGKYQQEKVTMAMCLGDSRKYKLRDIFSRHYLQTSKKCRWDQEEMKKVIEEVLDLVPNVIAEVSGRLSDQFPESLAQSIFKGMVFRRTHLEPS
jgi:serine/threonine-protein kinase HipA